jgi:hypothetical protein
LLLLPPAPRYDEEVVEVEVEVEEGDEKEDGEPGVFFRTNVDELTFGELLEECT